MLLCDVTNQKFGYFPDTLSSGSSKDICLSCDYCGIIYDTIMKRRTIAHKIIQKDACPKCKYIKMSEINQMKYGVDNVFQLKTVKEKIVSTNLEKYGVEFPQLNTEIRNKSKKTMLEKYGVENSSQSKELNDKRIATNLAKYGVANPSSNDEVKTKRKITNIARYGHEYYIASEDCRERVKQKYGVDNVFRLESIKTKIRSSRIRNGNIKIHNGKSIEDWAKNFGFSRSHFNDLVNTHGWEFAITCTKKYTNIDNMIRSILEKHSIEYLFDTSMGKYRPDFIIGKLIIEADGLWYHSDAVNKSKSYHEQKRLFYLDNKYVPLFFRQDEILKKTHIVESIILNKLGRSNKIYARNTSVSEIDKKLGSVFFRSNHIMGSGSGRCFALYNNGEIVACMRMKQITDGWEISRFSTKCGISVVGGFSKLISFFLNTVGSTNIVTFIDLRYGSGDYLDSLGFKSCGYNLSFKWTDGHESFHRMRFKGNSGYDNGLFKIWDCGQAKFTFIGHLG